MYVLQGYPQRMRPPKTSKIKRRYFGHFCSEPKFINNITKVKTVSKMLQCTYLVKTIIDKSSTVVVEVASFC